jgi:hypothetical protein
MLSEIFEFIDEFARNLCLADKKVEPEKPKEPVRNVDEFGRDLDMRKTKAEIEYEKATESLLSRFKGMSWAEMTWLIEDEEEEEANKVLREQDMARKALWQSKQADYELEEGEVFE